MRGPSQHKPAQPETGAAREPQGDQGDSPWLPPELWARASAGDGSSAPATPEACRAALASLNLCDAAQPAVTVELYGGLRLKSGCRTLPLHANTVGDALRVVRAVYPKLERLLPEDGAADSHYRYSVNGRDVTSDLSHGLRDGDHVIVFSASVGG